jgi:SAM-dependent methyltransferase
MIRSGSLIPVLEPGVAADRQNGMRAGSQRPESCAICGQAGAREWLQAPDRFHGRSQRYVLLRCSACSLVWLTHPPGAHEMHEHYTEDYHRLISAAGETSPRRWQRRGEALTQYKQSGALLDLGCSSGSFLEFLKAEPWKLYGIEMYADCAKRAEAKTGAQVFVGDILEAPFRRESFDVITCFDVLEHLYQPRRVMTRVGEWLKPGGIFYVSVPNIDSAAARVFGSYWHGLELPRHLFHYSPVSLRYLANSVGLQEVSLVTGRYALVGVSIRYFCDDFSRVLGISRTPMAYLGTPSFPWRVARKLVRLTVLRLLLTLAPLAGSGEYIDAVFEKGSA